MIAYHNDRKLFAYSFLFGVRRLCKHSGRKLFAKGFLFGMGRLCKHSDRKLFAYSFLSGMERLRITAAGNCLRIVSCPSCDNCV